MYLFWSSRSSTAASTTGTSGWAARSRSTPSGEAISPTNLIRRFPSAFNSAIVSTADPPVASIGSRISSTSTASPVGRLR
jgi:hypothetical protein